MYIKFCNAGYVYVGLMCEEFSFFKFHVYPKSNEFLLFFKCAFYICFWLFFFFPVRLVPLGSPIAREWLSSIANYPSSPRSHTGGGGACLQTGDESPVGRPGSVHTGTDDIDTDLQEDEEDNYKSLEIKKGPNVYSCSLHTNLKFTEPGRNV